MKIMSRRIARELSAVNGTAVSVFAAVSLIFAVLTLIFGTDGDVFGKYVFPKPFVSMFCYSLIFVSHMLFSGAYVGICVSQCRPGGRSEIAIYGSATLICSAAAVPLTFRTDAFFYSLLLLVSSACFYLLMTVKVYRGGTLPTLLTLLCGFGISYHIYLSFSLMLLN